jgi:trimethylamine corrinoid protein
VLTEQTIAEARKAIFAFNAGEALEVVRQTIARGDNPLELLNQGFIPAINEIGEKFSIGEMFLPELIQAAEVMKKVTARISESIPKGMGQVQQKGAVVIGTVQGDIHDIGKTLVVTMLGVHGYTVHDLGRDVAIAKFVEKAKEVDAAIVGSSALLTTTMTKQKELEEALKGAGLKGRVKTMVGGAPVTQRWAERIGADGYAENAHAAVLKADALAGR